MKDNEAESREVMDFAELLMASFVEVVNEATKAAGMKKARFAQEVWPESSPRAASSRWQTMRTVAPRTGRPQGVLISDAQRMATVLDEELSFLFLKASLRAKDKETALKAKKPGKPAKGRPDRKSDKTPK